MQPQTLDEALRAIDAAFAPKVDTRTPAERRAASRAYNFAQARRLIAELRQHRAWVAAHSRANPVGPSISCFYRDLAPERVARRMAEVARYRRLAAQAVAVAA